jgi:hypothetical protein
MPPYVWISCLPPSLPSGHYRPSTTKARMIHSTLLFRSSSFPSTYLIDLPPVGRKNVWRFSAPWVGAGVGGRTEVRADGLCPRCLQALLLFETQWKSRTHFVGVSFSCSYHH